MMATTHVLVGIGIAAAVSLVAPELSILAVVAAAAGGAFPDLDLYAGHRKSLHFPIYYPMLATGATVALVLAPYPWLWAVTLFLVAAAAHSLMDAFGGGLELRPWEGTSRRAVYSHYHGRWVTPRRWIRYDGAPEDMGLALFVALPSLTTFENSLELAVVALLGVSGVYVVLRRPMVAVAEWIIARMPQPLRGWLPRRFVEDVS